MFNLHLGDWSSYVDTTQEEIKGGTSNGQGGITLTIGQNVVEVKFSDKNLELIKERGIYIIGHGFTLKRIAIEGPKLASFDPQTLIKSKSTEQKVKLMFSEDATDLVGNIRLVNSYYNINKKLACIADYENKNNIYCEGLYDFTGEYQIVDDKGVSLTSRVINIVPKTGEKYDINNLLYEKFLFDIKTINAGVRLQSTLFTEVEDSSVLVFETTELFIQPSHRVLYVLIGDSNSVVKFDPLKVNVEVGEDGGIIIPPGNNLIKIALDKNYEIFQQKGIRIVGYGFGLKTVYVK